MKKRTLSLLLAIAMLCAFMPVIASADTSGTCGDNLTWTLDDDGTLTVSGTGEMTDFTSGGGPWAWYSKSITSVVIDNGVTSIGNYAFNGHSDLKSVTIGNDVTSIGYAAFRSCTGLTNTTIGNSVISIGDCAFYFCTSLTNINIPDSVGYIGYEAFQSCTALENVKIGIGVTSIGSSAFAYCTNLTSVRIKDGEQKIGDDYTFSDSSSLENIGDYAFSGCSSLVSIDIPGSVTSLGEGAFRSCEALTDVYITDLDAYLNIDIPDYSSNPLYYAKNLYINNELAENIVIPDGVEKIRDYAFYGLECVKSVVVPYGVTTIGDYAFCGCTELSDIAIPDSVTSIGIRAFSGCDALENINLPNSIISIGNYAFADSGLTNIIIPGNVTEIGSYAFSGCTELESLTFAPGASGLRILDYAFSQCTSLKNITIPKSRISFGDSRAFQGCGNTIDILYEGSKDERYIAIEGIFYYASVEWHYNCTATNTPVSTVSQTDNVIYIYANGGQDIVYDADKDSYNDDSFSLDISVYGLYLGDDYSADHTMRNADMTVTLPKGFSFYENSPVRSRRYTFDTLSAARHISETVYLDNPPTGEAELTIRVTADNAAAKKYIHKFSVSAYNFELNKYRAEFLLYDPTGETMEAEFSGDTPSGVIYKTGKENGLESAAAAWSAFMDTMDKVDSPSSLLDYTFEEKDIYSAIIMSMFESSVDLEVTSLMTSEITKQTNKLLSTAAKEMQTLYNIDMYNTYDFNNMTDLQKSKLCEIFEDEFKQMHPDIASVSKITGYVGDAIGYVGDFKTLCENAAAYYNINQLSGSMKNIMYNMYAVCPNDNIALKAALNDCISVMNSSQSAFRAEMAAYAVSVVGRDIAQYCIDKFWGDVKTAFCASHPAAFTFQAAYIAGKTVANTLFNADDIEEQYCKIAALMETWDLIKTVYSNKKRYFISADTEETALVYNSVIDVMYNMLDTDCDYAVKYADTVNDAWAQKILNAFGDTSIDEWKEKVESIRGGYNGMHKSVLTNWIYSLETDYPDKYDEYSSLLDMPVNELQKVLNINCPVDVYVLNKNGSVVGYIENNIPYCIDGANITIGVDGDSKSIYMYGDEYTVVYMGNDTGAMDIKVTEYDSGSEKRFVYFYGIPLTDGLSYTSYENGTILEEDAYILLADGEENIYPDYDSLASEEKTCKATIINGYFTSDLSVSSELSNGENAEITAYVPDGYKFVRWTSDASEDIFADASNATTTIRIPEYDVNITATIKACQMLTIKYNSDTSLMVNALNCDEVSNGIVILAIYDSDGSLKNMYTKNFAETVVFDNLDLSSGMVRAMLWNSLNDMTPLAESSK